MKNIHQCKILKLEGKHLHYLDSGHKRWLLCFVTHPDKIGDLDAVDQVLMQTVLFCPGCGKDLRKDTFANYIGKPYRNKTLIKAGCKRDG